MNISNMNVAVSTALTEVRWLLVVVFMKFHLIPLPSLYCASASFFLSALLYQRHF